MGRYWNGFQWRENDASSQATARINGPVGPRVEFDQDGPRVEFDQDQVREALLDEELNPRETTGEHEPLTVVEVVTGPRFEMCERCASEYDVTDGPCPVCLMLQPEQPIPNMVRAEPIITDEVRERIKRELKAKDDGGSK